MRRRGAALRMPELLHPDECDLTTVCNSGARRLAAKEIVLLGYELAAGDEAMLPSVDGKRALDDKLDQLQTLHSSLRRRIDEVEADSDEIVELQSLWYDRSDAAFETTQGSSDVLQGLLRDFLTSTAEVLSRFDSAGVITPQDAELRSLFEVRLRSTYAPMQRSNGHSSPSSLHLWSLQLDSGRLGQGLDQATALYEREAEARATAVRNWHIGLLVGAGVAIFGVLLLSYRGVGADLVEEGRLVQQLRSIVPAEVIARTSELRKFFAWESELGVKGRVSPQRDRHSVSASQITPAHRALAIRVGVHGAQGLDSPIGFVPEGRAQAAIDAGSARGSAARDGARVAAGRTAPNRSGWSSRGSSKVAPAGILKNKNASTM